MFRLSFFYTIRFDAETHQNLSPSMVNFAESSPATRVSSGSIAGATSTFNCGIHICWFGQSESPRQLKGRRVRRPLIAQKAAPCKWLLWRISCEMHTSTTTNAFQLLSDKKSSHLVSVDSSPCDFRFLFRLALQFGFIPPGEAESREDAIFEEGFDGLLQWRHLPMNTTDSMLQGLKFPHMDLFT